LRPVPGEAVTGSLYRPRMLSTASRLRAEGYIRGALAADRNPWEALDGYRRRGGRIHWNDWFRLWRRIASDTPDRRERRGGPAAGYRSGPA
jgi:hypothetical protein